MELLKLWTQKESLYKCSSKKAFNPRKIEVTDNVSTLKLVHEACAFLCSVSGVDTKKSFFYYFDGEQAAKIKDIVWF